MEKLFINDYSFEQAIQTTATTTIEEIQNLSSQEAGLINVHSQNTAEQIHDIYVTNSLVIHHKCILKLSSNLVLSAPVLSGQIQLHLLTGYISKILSRKEVADLCPRATMSALVANLLLVSISSPQLKTPIIHASASIAFQHLRRVDRLQH